tara:strand:- start:883 stop:2994 length:2112 start_codon:yes stop_codon:yes gene_type:complete
MPFTLDNLSTNDVTERSPWELDPATFNYPAKGFKSSHDYKAWARQQGTRYCAFSLIEGEQKNQRVTSTNEPVRIHGMVVDYDPAKAFTDTDVQSFVDKSLDGDHPCAYLSRSYSGGIHAVWFFEEPISVMGTKAATEFLKRASKELGLASLAAGLDKAVTKPTQYYLYGRDWQSVSQYVIPNTVTYAWMHAATKSATFADYGEPIPLKDIYEELEARWPGAWPGEFKEGARGPTFWDPHGGHRSVDSALVRENGMQVFNMEKGFYSWGEIFGHKFVSAYQQAQIGSAISNFFYDGRNFYEKIGNDYFQRTRRDVEIRLKVGHGLRSVTPRGATYSELEEALSTIITQKLVDAAVPVVFNKNQVVSYHGKKYLNTSRVRVMQPADEAQEWEVNFPFVAKLLMGVYGQKQLEYWLAWASRFYKGAYSGRPEAGHALFTIGDPGVGKTFINSGILGPLFGGEVACGPFLMGETNFNSSLFERGIWTIDDRVPASDSKKYQHYTSTIKSIVANASFTVDEKYQKAAYIPWTGRLSVTANYTQEDIRMIPELNESVKDKVMVFRGYSHDVTFGSRQENYETCQRELPYFARYLLDLDIPDELKGSNRFGVESYINRQVEAYTLNNGPHAYFLELLEIFEDDYFTGPLGENQWTGSATEFMKQLSCLDGANNFLKGVDAQRMGRSFNHYHQKGVDWLKRGNKKWTISKV